MVSWTPFPGVARRASGPRREGEPSGARREDTPSLIIVLEIYPMIWLVLYYGTIIPLYHIIVYLLAQ
jgi:hypothetical protein